MLGQGFDAGVRLADTVPPDMIAVPILPTTPTYLASIFPPFPFLAQPGSCGPSDCSRSMDKRRGDQAEARAQRPKDEPASPPLPRLQPYQTRKPSCKDEGQEAEPAHDHCAGCAIERPPAFALTATPKRSRRSATDSAPPSAMAAPPSQISVTRGFQ